MKTLLFTSLLTWMACNSPQSGSYHTDDLFEHYYQNRVMKTTRVDKPEYKSTEDIILTGYATNGATRDSNAFFMVPGGASNDLKFTLRNLRIDRTLSFHYLQIMQQIKMPQGHRAIQTKLAPQAQMEVFSFNLKDLLQLRFERWYPGIPENETVSEQIMLEPGIYEFTWVVGFGEVSKPAFFKIAS